MISSLRVVVVFIVVAGVLLPCTAHVHDVPLPPGTAAEVALADVTDMPPDSPLHVEAVANMDRSAPGVDLAHQRAVLPPAPQPSSDAPGYGNQGNMAAGAPEPSPEPSSQGQGQGHGSGTDAIAHQGHGHADIPRSVGGSLTTDVPGSDVTQGRPASRLDVLHNPNRFLAENQRRLDAGLPTFNFTGLTIDQIERMLFGRFSTTPAPTTQPPSSTDPDLAVLAQALSSLGSSQSAGSPSADSGVRGNAETQGTLAAIRDALSAREVGGGGAGGSAPRMDMAALAQALASLSTSQAAASNQASPPSGPGLPQGPLPVLHSSLPPLPSSVASAASSPVTGSGGQAQLTPSVLANAIVGALQRIGVAPPRSGHQQPTTSGSQTSGMASGGSLGNALWAELLREIATSNQNTRGDAAAGPANGVGSGSRLTNTGAMPMLGRTLGTPLAHALGFSESQVARETVHGPPDLDQGLAADLRREFAAQRERDTQLMELVNSLTRHLSNSAGLPSLDKLGPPAPPAPPAPVHGHGSGAAAVSDNMELLRHLHQDFEDLRARVVTLETDLRKANEDRAAQALALERMSAHVQRNELSITHLNATSHSLEEEMGRARDARVNMWRRIAELQRNLTLVEVGMKHIEVDFSLSLLVLGGNLTALENNVTSVNSSLRHQLSGVTEKIQGLQLCAADFSATLRDLSASNTNQSAELSKLAEQRCEMGDERIIQFPFDATKWPLQRQVQFSKHFARAPFVHVGIGGLQAERGFNLAIICTANHVSTSGFQVHCETNTNISRVYGVNVTWLACLL